MRHCRMPSCVRPPDAQCDASTHGAPVQSHDTSRAHTHTRTQDMAEATQQVQQFVNSCGPDLQEKLLALDKQPGTQRTRTPRSRSCPRPVWAHSQPHSVVPSGMRG